MNGNGSDAAQPQKLQHKVFVAFGQVEVIFAPCPCGHTTALIHPNAVRALRTRGEGLTIKCGQCGDELYLMMRRVLSK